jgi:hypothetical protein
MNKLKALMCAALFALVPLASANAPIRFHPGYYVEMDPNGGTSYWESTIAALKGAPGVAGVVLVQNWAQLEGSTQGDYSQGFALVDQLLADCAASHLQLIVEYEDRAFGANVPQGYTGSEGVLPAYMDTIENGGKGYFTAPGGTTWSGEGLQMWPDVNNVTVWAREIALGVAYLKRYDGNASFEMWRTPETTSAYFAAVGGTAAYDAYVQQYLLWMPALRAAGPHVAITISTNFLNTVTEFTTLYQGAAKSAVGVCGPDVVISNPPIFAGSATITYNGYEGGTDWRPILLCAAENQATDIPSSDNVTYLTTLYNWEFTGPLASGGSTQPHYWLIQDANLNAGFTLSSVSAWMATAPSLRNVTPTSYGAAVLGVPNAPILNGAQ